MKKNVLVVGGAAGIGRGVVLDRVQRGDHVFFSDINREAGEALVHEVKQLGYDVFYQQHNVTSWEETGELVKKAVEQLGEIDILVHCAGITKTLALEEMDFDTWRKTFSVNLTGLFYIVKAIIPEMIKTNGGKIVIIGSGSSITGSGGGVHYASSKGGAVGLMRAIAKKYSHLGIRINLVAPRVIETDMLNNLYKTKESKQKLIDKIPVGRLGTIKDTTNAVNFLASEESAFIQGQVLLLDGGRTYFQ